jgi:hypothetical protein
VVETKKAQNLFLGPALKEIVRLGAEWQVRYWPRNAPPLRRVQLSHANGLPTAQNPCRNDPKQPSRQHLERHGCLTSQLLNGFQLIHHVLACCVRWPLVVR